MEKLNTATESFDVPAEEWVRAAKFIAFQYVRTPAYRRHLQNIHAETMKAMLSRLAQGEKMFQTFVRTARESNPNPPEIEDPDKLRSFILSGEYDIRAEGDHFLGQALKSADPVYLGVLTKTPLLYRSTTNESFVTCDSPVILLRHPKSPPHWGAGWVNSHILFPIGKHAALLLQTHPGHLRKMEGPVNVVVRKVRGRLAWINRQTVNAAEQYVFADKPLKAIARIFSATKKPTRFEILSAERAPFVVLRQN